MTIQRYSPAIDRRAIGLIASLTEDSEGELVYLDDAERDKAKAVAAAVAKEQKKTAELRDELVSMLERDAADYPHATSQDGWLSPITTTAKWPAADRLVELGAWERLWSGTRFHYRPIRDETGAAAEDSDDD